MAKKLRFVKARVKKRAKKRVKKKIERIPIPTAVEPMKQLEAVSEMQSLVGRYSNHIQVSILKEEFVLDFFAQGGSQTTHQSRIFIAPAHAARLSVLLKRQVQLHEKKFGK